MKINNVFDRFCFQKKLVATGAVQKNGKSNGVKIYQFDSEEDLNDLYRAQQSENWKNNYYLEKILKNPRSFIGPDDVFTIENKDGDLLCYSIVDTDRKRKVNLIFLETAPKVSCYNSEKRDYHWVGETMVAFLTKIAGKRDLVVPHIASRQKTENFYYQNCKFTPQNENSAVMSPSKFNSLQAKNAEHTGKKIKIVG